MLRPCAPAMAPFAILVLAAAIPLPAAPPGPATFSIVAADPEAGEVGVAVASRFFAVGNVVPFVRARVGAAATQSFANVSFGPRALDLLAQGLTPDEIVKVLVRGDEGRDQRQLGVVSASGASATYTGPKCLAWAGGRSGQGYAVQGNILAGEAVVEAMERAFFETKRRPLAERLYAAVQAGDAAGGDARGRQSAAILVVRERAGYGGYTDRAVDIRVDDHQDPIRELGRLLGMAMVNDFWNRGWTAFTEERFAEALTWQERAATRAEQQPGMLPEVLYDLAVIRLANGNRGGAVSAARRAIRLNPKLEKQALADKDLEGIRPDVEKLEK